MKPAPAIPPWVLENDSHHWVTVSIAARFYFNKSLVTVKRYIKSGWAAEQGFPTYWDGKRWFIRLPVILNCIQKRQKRRSGTLSA